MNIWVILGGMSAEREVSLDSGREVSRVLAEGGHRVWAYDLRNGRFLPGHSSEEPPLGNDAAMRAPGWAEKLLGHARMLRGRADVAFLALHGAEGEDGTIQTLLSSVSMPYTGSGSAACAVAMNKVFGKWIMESIGILTPPWSILRAPADVTEAVGSQQLADLPDLPVVVKPIAQGSSVGVSIVSEAAELEPAIQAAVRASCGSPGSHVQLLVEEYIPGRELTVGILGDRPLPVVEIEPRSGFYDYERKYTPGGSSYRVPADLGGDESRRLQEKALRLFEALGCRGMARVDFRFSPGGEGYCLELNTIPGLTTTSLFPMGAAAAGFSFVRLLEEICRLAQS